MGELHRFLGIDRGPGRSRHRRLPRPSGRPTTPTSPTAPTPSSASTTCATTWPGPRTPWSSAATSSPSWTRSTRSSSTRPGRPLIISGPAAESAQLYYQFAGIVRTLRAEDDYEVDEEKRIVVPTEAGIEKVEKPARRRQPLRRGVGQLRPPADPGPLGQGAVPAGTRTTWWPHGEVKIVDEFTGRTLDGRRWSDGLHQAVEAKERVRIKEENHTWATVTLQNYFRLYEKLSGMTGHGRDRGRRSSPAPTTSRWSPSRPTSRMVREDKPDLIYKTEDAKFERRGRGHRRAPRRRASRCWSARPRWPSPSSCPGCSSKQGHPPRGPQRQAALPGSGDRRPGRPAGRA